jgi:hypothetical protein
MTEKVISNDFANTRQLAKLKAKALRSGVWFKALRRIDRALIDVTIKVAKVVRNAKLLKIIFTVANKLENALPSGLSQAIEEIGVPLAQKLSATALMLGNVSAGGWATDFRLARFLAVVHINNPEWRALIHY